MRGMSAGSFCRSPSAVTTSRPRANANPAANAAVWPKLRRKRMTRRCGSRACSAASWSNVSSVLPSSMTMISYERPPRIERGRQLVVEGLDVGRLVADRNDDRKLGSHRAGIEAIIYVLVMIRSRVPVPAAREPARCWDPGPLPTLLARLAVVLGLVAVGWYASLGPDPRTLRREGAPRRLAAHPRQPDAGLGADRRGVAAAAAPAQHAAGADRSSLSHRRVRDRDVGALARAWRRRRSRRPCCALTASRAGATLAAALFATNPNVLYLQSTPMTEPLLFGLTTLQVFLFTTWVLRGRLDACRAAAGWVTVLACLTRYEAWPITGCLFAASAFAWWRRGHALGRHRARARAARGLSGRDGRSASWCSAASRSASGSSAAASSCPTKRCGASRRSCSKDRRRASTLLGGTGWCADADRARCSSRWSVSASAGRAPMLVPLAPCSPRPRCRVRRISPAIRFACATRFRLIVAARSPSGWPSGCSVAGHPSSPWSFSRWCVWERPPFDRARADGRRGQLDRNAAGARHVTACLRTGATTAPS